MSEEKIFVTLRCQGPLPGQALSFPTPSRSSHDGERSFNQFVLPDPPMFKDVLDKNELKIAYVPTYGTYKGQVYQDMYIANYSKSQTTNIIVYPCPICHKTFEQRSKLKRHKAIRKYPLEIDFGSR